MDPRSSRKRSNQVGKTIIYKSKIKYKIPGIKLNEDEDMMYRHGEEFGDGLPKAEKGEGSQYDMLDSIPVEILNKPKLPKLLIYFSVNYTLLGNHLVIIIIKLLVARC